MAEVHYLGGVTKLDLPPDRILEGAKGQLTGCVVLGYDQEGKFYEEDCQVWQWE